jgi:hypothetical protein
MLWDVHVMELTLCISGVGHTDFSQQEQHWDVSHLLLAWMYWMEYACAKSSGLGSPGRMLLATRFAAGRYGRISMGVKHVLLADDRGLADKLPERPATSTI